MSRRKIKKQVGIGVCSPYIRPQKYETRDPFPYLNFGEPMPQVTRGEIAFVAVFVISIVIAVCFIFLRSA